MLNGYKADAIGQSIEVTIALVSAVCVLCGSNSNLSTVSILMFTALLSLSQCHRSIRGLFDWFIIDSREELYTAIIDKKRGSLMQLVIDIT